MSGGGGCSIGVLSGGGFDERELGGEFCGKGMAGGLEFDSTLCGSGAELV